MSRLHFAIIAAAAAAANNMGLSSFKSKWWAPKLTAYMRYTHTGAKT